VPRHKVSDWPSQDFFDAREAEQEEGVSHLADVEGVEGKDELQLVLLVVADVTHEGVLRLVYQIFV